MIRRLVVGGIAVLALLAMAAPAFAHPLGNFTSNTFARLRIQPEAIAVDYVLDLAEIPTLQTLQRIEGDDDRLSPAESTAYADRRCEDLAAGLQLTVAEQGAPLEVQEGRLALLPGQAGLQTLRLECDLRTAAIALDEGAQVRFADGNLLDRVGWREIIAVADGRAVATADVPAVSASDELRTYPEQQLSSPLAVTQAQVSVGASGGAAAPAGGSKRDGDPVIRGVERLTSAFTGLVADRPLTPAFALLAALLSLVLGAMHAVAPGHGKTVMAAYLVGREGTPRDAVLLGGTVALTHTAGVLLLGVVLSASQTLAPERLYPVLGAISGVLFALVGVTLLRQALRNRGHGHSHSHSHGPDDDPDDSHDHVHHHGSTPPRRRTVGARALVLPGLAGGLVPSPSALVVLLGGIAIGRAWFGVALVIGYGLGMAATLVGAGYLLLRARTTVQRRTAGRWRRAAALTAALPLISAALIIAGGVVIVARSVALA